MIYFISFVLSLLITIRTIPHLISFLKENNLLDYPGGRKIHLNPVPRLGGFILGIILLIAINFLNFYNPNNIFLSFALFTILITGLIDDIKGINYAIKFVLQFTAAFSLVHYFSIEINTINLFGFVLPPVLDKIILAFFIVGSINAVNLLDGMDGLVSRYAIWATVLIFILAFSRGDFYLMLLSVIILGNLMGFLKYNSSPAKIFLGDTGSLTIGFILVYLILDTSMDYFVHSIDLSFAGIFLGLPIIDAFRVFILRIVNKKNPFKPDNNHIHHILVKSFIKKLSTVFVIDIYQFLFVASVTIYIFGSTLFAALLFSILLINIFFINHTVKIYNSITGIVDDFSLTLQNKLENVREHSIIKYSSSNLLKPVTNMFMYFFY